MFSGPYKNAKVVSCDPEGGLRDLYRQFCKKPSEVYMGNHLLRGSSCNQPWSPQFIERVSGLQIGFKPVPLGSASGCGLGDLSVCVWLVE